MKIKNIILIIGLLWPMLVCGQQKKAYHDRNALFGEECLSLNLGGGLGSLSYDVPQGTMDRGRGYQLEIQYQRVPERWGYGIGLQFNSIRSNLELNSAISGDFVHPDNNLPYVLNTKLSHVKEQQEVHMLDIPIQILYHNPMSNKCCLQAGFGLVFGLPILSSYSVNGGQITTDGYFPSTNVDYTNLPNHGFGTKPANGNGDIKSGMHVGLQWDLGTTIHMSDDWGLYVGLFMQNGLNRFSGKSRKPLYDGATYNGYLNSDIADYAHTIQFGIKMGIRLNIAN